jgi:hypothetical protein
MPASVEVWCGGNLAFTDNGAFGLFHDHDDGLQIVATGNQDNAQFDATYREIGRRRRGADDNAQPPSFDRKFAKGNVQIPEVYAQFPLGNVRTVQMACVLPSHFALGETTAIDCKLIENGELEVAIYSADGKSKIASLKKWNALGGGDGREGVNYLLFDGKLPDGKTLEPGNYRVRWTVTNDGYREFPITVLAAK